MQADQIALQLYTVRGRAAADLQGTLRALAEIGYTAVEFAGYQGVPVAELRSTLDELGMRAMAAHVQYTLLDAEPDRAIEEVKALGGDFVVVPGLAEGLRGDLDAVHRVAETFNAWGERCRAAGVTFAYHNHAFEFAPLPGADGATMYDVLVARTDPALVYLELDVFWVQEGGGDPLELLRLHTGRVPLVHLKDKDASDGSDAPVGAGTIAWQPVLDAAEAGARWYVVEQDHPKDPMADVATSLRNLKAMASSA